ncbi:hypothetical protein KIL84_012989 [Mauremys mutica]|uniref:Uncharacterized protein n=1 Tax=Mauremys mutica TaxID=74926 RepID=A0A9D3XTG6_9SAUR|nr:hypothetical protein KIL84_012989 [Mauremys mutica]
MGRSVLDTVLSRGGEGGGTGHQTRIHAPFSRGLAPLPTSQAPLCRTGGLCLPRVPLLPLFISPPEAISGCFCDNTDRPHGNRVTRRLPGARVGTAAGLWWSREPWFQANAEEWRGMGTSWSCKDSAGGYKVGSRPCGRGDLTGEAGGLALTSSEDLPSEAEPPPASWGHQRGRDWRELEANFVCKPVPTRRWFPRPYSSGPSAVFRSPPKAGAPPHLSLPRQPC